MDFSTNLGTLITGKTFENANHSHDEGWELECFLRKRNGVKKGGHLFHPILVCGTGGIGHDGKGTFSEIDELLDDLDNREKQHFL